MNYTEWRDELKSNLLSVSEAERRRVLDYYAEAYADRREAGFSEREITSGFGAPYDAAQRILYDKGDDFTAPPQSAEPSGAQNGARNAPPPPPPAPKPAPQPYTANPYPSGGGAAVAEKPNNMWIFVLLCIIFCVPLFMLIMAMVGITIGFCVAPVAVIGAGGAIVGSSFGTMIGGELNYGLFLLGSGIIVFGVGIILCPLFFKLVGVMWKLFGKLFKWLKSLFGGK